jgi:hypothetical protein
MQGFARVVLVVAHFRDLCNFDQSGGEIIQDARPEGNVLAILRVRRQERFLFLVYI